MLQRDPATDHLAAAVADDLVRDAALRDASEDRFDHEAIASVVADIALSAELPVNIGLFGPWGSGKSSFYNLLKERIKSSAKSVKVARYDAWKYGGKALKRHFVASVAEELELHDTDFIDALESGDQTTKLRLGKWIKNNWPSLLIGLSLAIGVAVVWFGIVSLMQWAIVRHGWSSAMQATVASLGTVASAALLALFIGPKVFEGASYKTGRAAPEGDDQFARSFQELVNKAIDVDKNERLVVFVDELDRCAPDDVVSTLIDLRTFLDIPGCVFVVAADREVLEHALTKVPQVTPVRQDDPYYSTPGAFLDKIFQHQIALPPLRPQALTRYAIDLVERQGGVWAELRDLESEARTFLEVVYALVPVHVRSPRRVKVLLNNFATNTRIIAARNLLWKDRVSEIAVYTTLQTEFPSVAADLVHVPKLLTYLRGADYSAAGDHVELLVEKYRVEEGKAEESAAGALLPDPTNHGDTQRANGTLIAQLDAYLARIAAEGIPDPRPDLFFLQTAGADDGLDPELGTTIDVAADIAPQRVIDAFAEQPSAVRATGVRLMVRQSEFERGPGRSNIIEAACRMVESLDEDDIRAVAPAAAPAILAESLRATWRQQATPGALMLGVASANPTLVDQLLKKYTAPQLIENGLLTRLSPILEIADTPQVESVRELIADVYPGYPTALHEALASLPLTAAMRLWSTARPYVAKALEHLTGRDSDPVPAAPAVVGAAAAPAAPPEPRPSDDTAEERFAALVDAVLARQDDAQQLISAVLAFGQPLDIDGIGDAIKSRAAIGLERITDPELQNRQALLGLTYAPTSETGFYRTRLGSGPVDSELAASAFKALLKEIPQATGEEFTDLNAAALDVLSLLTPDDSETVTQALSAALEATAWPIAQGDSTLVRRSLYNLANSARPTTGDALLDELIAHDILTGLDAGGEISVAEAIRLIKDMREPGARVLDDKLGEVQASPQELRLRIAARTVFAGPAFPASEVLAVDVDQRDIVASEWLALNPAPAEVIELLRSVTFTASAVGPYASRLKLSDRSKLWTAVENRGASTVLLAAVGKDGIDSDAIHAMADKIAAETTQSGRDTLVDRLVTAKFSETPTHRQATELALYLLSTHILGDGALAAKLVIRSGGAAHGKTPQLRDALTEYSRTKNNKLTNAHKKTLVDLNLLTNAKKKKKKGLAGFVDSLLGG